MKRKRIALIALVLVMVFCSGCPLRTVTRIQRARSIFLSAKGQFKIVAANVQAKCQSGEYSDDVCAKLNGWHARIKELDERIMSEYEKVRQVKAATAEVLAAVDEQLELIKDAGVADGNPN